MMHGIMSLKKISSNMFRCNHQPQGAYYFNLLKLHMLKQPIKTVNSEQCSTHTPARTW